MKQFMISTGYATLTVLMMLVSNVGQAASKDGNVTAATTPVKASNEKATTVCAACHGANGVSVAAHIPNLASQKVGYLEAQLGAFKDGTRKNEIMNAIAAQLRDEDIASLAVYFSAQSVSASAKSAFLPNLAKTNVRFPADYKSGFRLYHTINDTESKQVKLHYANQVALSAVKAGKPIPDGSSIFVEIYSAKLDSDKKPIIGNDAFFVPDRLLSYAVMSSGKGWGTDIPEMLRNDNWNYAIFSPDRQLRTTINQAECLACHKPARDSSYVFTLKHM